MVLMILTEMIYMKIQMRRFAIVKKKTILNIQNNQVNKKNRLNNRINKNKIIHLKIIDLNLT